MFGVSVATTLKALNDYAESVDERLKALNDYAESVEWPRWKP
jgi:hypothetical protein